MPLNSSFKPHKMPSRYARTIGEGLRDMDFGYHSPELWKIVDKLSKELIEASKVGNEISIVISYGDLK